MPENTMTNNIEYRAQLNTALVNAIAETKDVHADSTNPFHKNKYASLGAHLESIKPIFQKHGLAILQFPTSSEKAIGVNTIIVHTSGASIEESICIPVADNVKGQEAGAIISYLRRYALASVAGVATEDDDAEIDRISRSPTTNAIVNAKPAYSSVQPTKFIPNPNASVSEVTGEINFELTVPFGKAKGTSLNDLPLSDLNYWANTWQPKPWEKTGKVGAKDLSLKSSAQALWAIKNAEQGESDSEGDAIPF
jgi:uncharacterized protein (DUF3820 family)